MTDKPTETTARVDQCARSNNRAQLVIMCEARQGSRPWQRVRLDDLSPSGFRLNGMMQVSPALALSIRIPGMQLLSAKVRWHRSGELGCEFAAPLHISVFDHIVRTAA